MRVNTVVDNPAAHRPVDLAAGEYDAVRAAFRAVRETGWPRFGVWRANFGLRSWFFAGLDPDVMQSAVVRVYLLLVSDEVRERIPPVALRAARRAVHAAFPVPPDVVEAVEWTAPDGHVALFGWSNEPEDELLPATVIEGSGRRVGYCGYLAEPKRDADLLLTEGDLGAVAAELGGVFAVFRASEDGIEAATSMARVCPVYHAEAAGVRVVGSRALLVHLVARAVETGVEEPEVDFAVEALHPVVRHGFFTNDDTPFRGVRALAAGSVLTAVPGRRTAVRQQAVPGAREPKGRGQRELVRPLAEALVDSAAPLARHVEPVSLSLSGGRTAG